MKSNTSRRAIFQHEYPEALAEADIVVLSAPWKKDDLPPELLINIPKIVEDLKSKGIEAYMIPTVDEIVDFVAKHVKPGDVVLGMSGSAFGGFHKKLLDKLDG
jgi:UDP-N-acetylmuramate: L-alanyl-gamma-D-glutamyl-meso-diaminopimelate ligase